MDQYAIVKSASLLPMMVRGFLIISFVVIGGCQSGSASKHAGSLEMDSKYVAEVCSEIEKGQLLEFRFISNIPVKFNLHYHEAEAEVEIVGKRSTESFKHAVSLDSTQEYCLTWTAISNSTKIIYEYTFH